MNLGTVATNKLIQEVLKRYDVAVIHLRKRETVNDERIKWVFKGKEPQVGHSIIQVNHAYEEQFDIDDDASVDGEEADA